MVVTDLREELVAYVRGVPYLRRELEMPAAALHHAGALYNFQPDAGLCPHGVGVALVGLVSFCFCCCLFIERTGALTLSDVEMRSVMWFQHFSSRDYGMEERALLSGTLLLCKG